MSKPNKELIFYDARQDPAYLAMLHFMAVLAGDMERIKAIEAEMAAQRVIEVKAEE